MGHEIAHALAKHTAERMSTAMASQAALQVGAIILGNDSAASLGLTQDKTFGGRSVNRLHLCGHSKP
jgi:predicted Zn-dependent protease